VHSPCDRLRAKALVGVLRPRSRLLDNDEVFAFWRAIGRLPYPFGPAARMLLLCGQRHREVAHARWAEFHPELVALLRRHAKTGEPIAWPSVPVTWKVWSVGEERFKSDATHLVALSDDLCALLATLPHFQDGDHLFSANTGAKPTVLGSKIKHRIDARMLRTLKALARRRGNDPARVELKPFVFHDLRRVLRTALSALRVDKDVAEMAIGHGKKGLQRVYDQHQHLPELREAMTLWAARLREIAEPQPSAVVIPMMRKAS
jgi:integrase